MTYEPNEAEIKAFQVIISRELYEEPSQYMAQVILRHYEPRTREQRCNRSGYLYGRVLMGDPGPVEQRCPGCVNCAVEPAKDGGRARGMRESVTTSGTGVAQLTTPPVAPITICGKPVNYICSYCLRDEHPRPCQEFFEKTRREFQEKTEITTIALDDRTLRGLMAAVLTQQWTSAALNRADEILAEIDKAKEASK